LDCPMFSFSMTIDTPNSITFIIAMITLMHFKNKLLCFCPP
jgi:hypothetical protein